MADKTKYRKLMNVLDQNGIMYCIQRMSKRKFLLYCNGHLLKEYKQRQSCNKKILKQYNFLISNDTNTNQKKANV